VAVCRYIMWLCFAISCGCVSLYHVAVFRYIMWRCVAIPCGGVSLYHCRKAEAAENDEIAFFPQHIVKELPSEDNEIKQREKFYAKRTFP
jgi:hypothetical protein